MMALRLVHRPDGSEPVPGAYPIAAAGSTIGRAPECDLVLDDPVRLVSRRHAWLVPRGDDAALLRCISTSASMLVNGEALPPGAERVVHSGDRLRIGVFELLLEPGEPAPVSAPPVFAPPPVAPLAARPPSAPLAVMPQSAAPLRRPRLDQWFDLDSVADPLGPGSPLPLPDATAGFTNKTNRDPGRATVRGLSPPPIQMPARSPEPRREPDPKEATRREIAAVAAPPPPRAPAEHEPAVVGLDALQRAFLRGAGLDPSNPFHLSPATMEHLGALLRTTTEGTLSLLRSRAMAKRSIRAEGTHIVARENNPLKFAPDATHALMLLLTLEGRSGFLGPIDALRDAHNDLQVHQVAMAAGMRAAVFELISRLGPEAVEAEEGPVRGLAQRLSALRDAALWRRHSRSHARMLENLDDTLESSFGREFLIAYEAQSKLAAAAAAAAQPDTRPASPARDAGH